MPLGSLPAAHSSLSVLSSSRCATCAEGVTAGWLPLSFHGGRNLLPLACCTSHSLVMRWLHHSLLLCLLHCSEVIQIYLLISAGLEVGYHHFEPLRQPAIEAVTLQFSDVIWQKAFWEWSHKNLEVPQQMHPHSDTDSFLPICRWKSSWSRAIQVLNIVVMFIQYGNYAIQNDVCPWASYQLPGVDL